MYQITDKVSAQLEAFERAASRFECGILATRDATIAENSRLESSSKGILLDRRHDAPPGIATCFHPPSPKVLRRTITAPLLKSSRRFDPGALFQSAFIGRDSEVSAQILANLSTAAQFAGLRARGPRPRSRDMLQILPQSMGQLDPQHTPEHPAESLQVHALDSGDLPGVERHLLTLDPASRQTRFGSPFPDSSVAAYVRQIDLRRALLIGAVDGTDGRIVGLAEAQPTTSTDRVEMAVSVHMPYRRKGIGRCLITMAMNRAFCRGTAIAEFFFERDNRAAVGLVKSLGGRFGVRPGRVEIKLADWLKITCDV